MIIEVVIFFMFVILFVVVGGVISWMMRRKGHTATQSRTGWPLRNWIILFIVIVIFGPLTFHWVRNAAHKEARRESLEQKPVNGGTGASTPVTNSAIKDVNDSAQKGIAAGGKRKGAAQPERTAASVGKDTSYHVASPPQH